MFARLEHQQMFTILRRQQSLFTRMIKLFTVIPVTQEQQNGRKFMRMNIFETLSLETMSDCPVSKSEIVTLESIGTGRLKTANHLYAARLSMFSWLSNVNLDIPGQYIARQPKILIASLFFLPARILCSASVPDELENFVWFNASFLGKLSLKTTKQ